MAKVSTPSEFSVKGPGGARAPHWPRRHGPRRGTAWVELNLLDPDFLADPYPIYHQLRTEDPIHRHPLGFYVLTRYADVAAFLRDTRFGKSGYQA
jgi:cytochrome P450